MYRVVSNKVSEIVSEVMGVEDEELLFNASSVTSTALIKIRELGRHPFVLYKPIHKELVGIYLNSFINVMNVDYGGNMDILIYLASTTHKEQCKRLGSTFVETLGNISTSIEKSPKAKSKITLIFDSDSTTNAGKILDLFSPKKFSVLIRHKEVKRHKRGTNDLVDEFSRRGYELKNLDIF